MLFLLGLARLPHDIAASRLRDCSAQYSPWWADLPARVHNSCRQGAQMIDELTHPTARYPQPAELLAVLLMDRCAFAEVWPDTPLE